MRVKVNLILVTVFALIGIAQIASTYPVLNQTFDEQFHITAGMEWLQHHRYRVELIHPPLARIAVALGPFLAGRRLASTEITRRTWLREGNDLLHSGGSYFQTLTFARLGILPFFLVATTIVWIWAWRVFGPTVALLATVLFTTLPIVLAQSGLATTDMPGTAMLLAALFAFWHWLDKPTVLRSFMLGFCLALAILSKFSNLVFLPVCALVVFVVRYLTERGMEGFYVSKVLRSLAHSCFAGVVAFAVLWGGYRFSTGPLTTIEERPHATIDNLVGHHGWLHDVTYAAVEAPVFPLTELLSGVLGLKAMNDRGRGGYLLGSTHNHGVWYFFPTAVAFKTPIPFLIFVVVGVIFLVRKCGASRHWEAFAPLFCAVGVMSVCVMANLNFGVRHILPIYPCLAIVAAFGADSMWKAGRSVGLLALALLLWQVISTLRVRPDFLPYFNELARSKPDQILVDSDLDWGQDLKRLGQALETRNVKEFSISYFGTADRARFGLPANRDLVPHQCSTGWIAISITNLKRIPGYQWLDQYEPVALVGRSIKLYQIPKDSCYSGSNAPRETETYS